jgi:hypothetical protein
MYIYIYYIYIIMYIYIIHGFNGDSMMIWPPEILTKNGPSLPWIECDQARDVGLCIASSTTRWIFTWDWSHSLWFSVASAALILHCTRDMPNQRVGAEWHQSEQHRPRKIPGSADIFDTRHATRCSMDIGWRAHLQRVSCFRKAMNLTTGESLLFAWFLRFPEMMFCPAAVSVDVWVKTNCPNEMLCHFAKHSHVV